MTMDAATAAALEASIAHWRRLVDMPGKRVKRLKFSDRDWPNDDHCALCQCFLKGSACFGCPVQRKTRKHMCDGSPYWDTLDTFCAYQTGNTTLRAWRRAAQAELRFLEGLREKV